MFRGMEYVYEVYKEKSFSKAAANLYISQPSLSANVRRVEEKTGYPIFDRSTKPLSLTAVGRRYIHAVEQIMSIEKDFEAFINDMGELHTGSLRIGGSSFFSSWVLPPMISQFSMKYPALDISLSEAKSAVLVDMLKDGKIDFLLDNKELDTAVFDRYCIGKEQLLLTVPESFSVNQDLARYQIPIDAIRDGSYRKASYQPVPLEKFKDYPFIILRTVNDTGSRAMRICKELNFHPDIAFVLDQQQTAYNISSSGAGIAFVGQLLLSRAPSENNLYFYKLDSEHATRNIYFYWKKARYISRAMEEFAKNIIYETKL